MQLGLQALVCFLQAARYDQELKARRHVSKALWIFSATNSLSTQKLPELYAALEKYGTLLIPLTWVPWYFVTYEEKCFFF